jgi:hypothetical protein
MVGDDCVRFCGQCKLSVYNLSAMTQEEGERLIIEKEGKLCARVYRRADGTILTKDCPVGVALLRKRIVGFSGAIAATLLCVAGAAISAIVGQRSREQSLDPFEGWRPPSFQTVTSTVTRWLNTTPQPQAGWLAGDVTWPTPQTPSNASTGTDVPANPNG